MAISSVELASIFSADGLLSQSVEGFRHRIQQLEMAEAIRDAISDNSTLVVEAGTGTGKTFAYLAPALLSGGKTILSTGTKTLQDQLFNRDIPMMRDALKVSVTVALLKGRSNYICHYHLERTLREGRLASKEDAAYLKLIESYARHSGDKGGLSTVPEDAAIWPQVTSTRESCLGSDCPNAKECYVTEARKAAMQADMVVVNHHLFFADWMLKDEGIAELLPSCNTMIFDEAHQIPEVASLFFGESVSTGQMLELARDVKSEWVLGAKDYAPLPDAAAIFEKSVKDCRLAIEEADLRLPFSALKNYPDFIPALAFMQKKLCELSTHLESQAQRSEGLENCWQRSVELLSAIERWQENALEGAVRWIEIYSQALQLNATPLSIAKIFEKQMAGHPRAWIFTSATLAVKGNFDHYLSEMGLVGAKTACWESPFDYQNQALLYVPELMPDPNSRDYTKAVVDAALPVVRASRGRAFLLFTSIRAMKYAHSLLLEEKLDYPLLLQGEGAKSDMLDRFRTMGNAVLLGSQSFWEGVDVRGEALSLVVIDRLPFSPPDDPVLSARIEEINSAGRNAFMEYQLPHAVLSLKQGAGRLIRSESDRGVLMICDPRIIAKSYGRKIWQSLPPMKRTRGLEEVIRFFA